MQLYHYTCIDRAPYIHRNGLLKPGKQPVLNFLPLVWLTDLDTPDRDALGLTMQILKCDRTAFRAVADKPTAVHWPLFVRQHRDIQFVRRKLEDAPGALPAHWWVSTDPVPIAGIQATRALG